jgi:ATP-binding cassette subfamily F protein 3
MSKKQARKAREEERAINAELDLDLVDEGMSRLADKLFSRPAVDQGVAELFEKKLSKEERKELAAKKKAERDAKKGVGEKGAGDDEAGADEGSTKGKATARAPRAGAETRADRVLREAAELDAELEEARLTAVRLRSQQGAYMGVVESAEFSLPNPGGGPDLLEKAQFTLERGRKYALVGRNGTGKSTLLKAMASRRAGGVHPAVTIHYVSQEVVLSAASLLLTPVDVVVRADVERRLLLAEHAELTAAEERGAEVDSARLQHVLDTLTHLDSDTVELRARQLLTNLGFSAELIARPMAALSGGWRVRTALAAAIFSRPDMLLLDEPTNHLSIGAVLWLVRELTTNPAWAERIVVVVSHDRFFLDEVCEDVLHVSGVAKR